MELGFVNDLTTSVSLDSQLTTPSSGVFLNSGVHAAITLQNLLANLPKSEFTLNSWNGSTTYGDFLESRSIGDLVEENGVIYQSKVSPNVGNAVTDDNFWLPTNTESIRLKIFIQKVKDRVYNDLNLETKLIGNQYLYEIGDVQKDLPSDYVSWTFEAKGSNYVKFRLNQVAIQANTTGSVDLYVVNQGSLVTTISIPVNNGVFSWQPVNYSFSGVGKWHFVIDSQSVQVGSKVVDPHNFEGFIAYTSAGTGVTPQAATYSDYMVGIGVGVDLSVYFDPQRYIDNNVLEFTKYIRAAFEYVYFENLVTNAGIRSNVEQRTQQMDLKRIQSELNDLENNTIGKRYHDAKEEALILMRKAHDVQLSQASEDGSDSLDVETGSM